MTESCITIPEIATELTEPTVDDLLVVRNMTTGEDNRVKLENLTKGLGYTPAGTGAVATTVESKLNQFAKTPEDFGAVGNNSALDTAAFLAFRAWCLTFPSNTVFTLNCEKGRTYLVADPWWPCDIKNLIANGNGCKIKNSATDNKDKSLLNPAAGTNAAKQGSFYVPVARYLINTTTIGANTIQCVTSAEAANLAVGEMIMIASFDIQFASQPSSYRQFEYAKVTNVNAGTGVVTLDRRIVFRHQADYPYRGQTQGDGRAHIEKIETAALFDINHTYNDIEFVRNDVSAAGATSEAAYCTGYKITMNRCKAPYFLPTQAGDVELNQCIQTETGEFDKLVRSLVLNDSEFRGRIDSGTSIQVVEARRTKFLNGYRLAPFSLRLIDCDVTATTQDDVTLFTAYGGIKSLEIVGGNHAYLPTYSVLVGQTKTIVINGVNIIWNGTTAILTVNDFEVVASRDWVGKLFVGRIVHVTANNGAGREVPTGVYGVVRSITGGFQFATVNIEFIGGALAGTERLTLFEEPEYTNILNQRDYVIHRHTNFFFEHLKLTTGLTLSYLPTMGRPVKLTVDVLRPYTGATGGNVTLAIQSIFPVFGRLNRSINLKTAGRREATLLGNAGWTGAGGESVGANLPLNGYVTAFLGQLSFAVSAFASASDTQLPIVNVYIEFESPLTRQGIV